MAASGGARLLATTVALLAHALPCSLAFSTAPPRSLRAPSRTTAANTATSATAAAAEAPLVESLLDAISRQRDGATGSGYLTSGGEEEFKSINAIATILESDAAKAGPPRLPSDSLLGDWTLLYSSNRFTAAGGGKLLEGEQAPGGVRDIRQVITRDTFSNVVTLAPWPGVIDAFKGASVTLSLDHDYKVVSQSYPARLRISLREVRRAFSTDDESEPDWQGENFLTKLVPKSSQYTVPAPFRRDNSPLSEFDVTYLSETLRITRGTGAGQELRIFQRAPYEEEVWGTDEVYPTTD